MPTYTHTIIGRLQTRTVQKHISIARCRTLAYHVILLTSLSRLHNVIHIITKRHINDNSAHVKPDYAFLDYASSVSHSSTFLIFIEGCVINCLLTENEVFMKKSKTNTLPNYGKAVPINYSQSQRALYRLQAQAIQ